ncbi:hypothetical protein BC828DRAFT_390412 [Blastocladiella britannica]|nr:hypothetical protein BC828DRAFT_390412 [Blastocladiella britannica]
MVLIHIKRNDDSLFLASLPAATPTADVITHLVGIHNARLRIERLSTAIEDLAKYGIAKPFEEHGYQPEDLDQLVSGKDDSGAVSGVDELVTVQGREYIKCVDPTGRRTGLAPLPTYVDAMTKTIADARESISKNLVAQRIVTTPVRLNESIDLLKASVTMAYPMGLPEYDPVAEILAESEDLRTCLNAKDILDADSAQVWWAGKELVRGKLLLDFVGRNDKTTIVAKLTKRGSGAPMREPPLNEQAQREMMAYYYRKQEELKKLEDDDDDFSNSAWANPKALKSSFQGMGGGVSWKPR